MSTNLPATENDNKYVIMYSIDIMKARIFGAFLCAADYRREADGVSRKMIADFISKDEGSISKLLSKPSNMTVKTITELCEALNVEFQFALVDRNDPQRIFLDVGIKCRHVHHSQNISHAISAEIPGNYVFEAAAFQFGKRKKRVNHLGYRNMAVAPLLNYASVGIESDSDDR